MDLNTTSALMTVSSGSHRVQWPSGDAWRPGDAWLAGGSWLFSEPQPDVYRLIDLSRMGWSPIRVSAAGMEIAATCTLAELFRLAPEHENVPASLDLIDRWPAATLISFCCRAFSGSQKIWNVATVGGNLCLSLAVSPMISLAASLGGICTIWARDGGARQIKALDFVLDIRRNALEPGELLRSVFFPADALRGIPAARRMSLHAYSGSAALLIGLRDPKDGGFSLTITAATRRPVVITFPSIPCTRELAAEIAAAVPSDAFVEDELGSARWRAHLVRMFAEQIRLELERA